jgi:hypothetical protein
VSYGAIGDVPVGVRPGSVEARDYGLSFATGGARPVGAATESFGFDDLLDIINPLQHLPVVGTLYREWTGDAIGPTARVIGSGLFGGPLGLAFGILNAIFEDAAGQDMGSTIYAGLFGADETEPAPAPEIALAAAEPEPDAALDDRTGLARPRGGAPTWYAVPSGPPVEAAGVTPPGAPITNYDGALQAMAKALDRYETQARPGEVLDEKY